MRREPTIALREHDVLPLYLQITRSIAADVQAGRLRPGDALPGSRALAASLGVHRNTILAAYTELAVEGWVVTKEAGGTFIAQAPPVRRMKAVHGIAAQPGYRVEPALYRDHPPEYRPGTLLLARGLPDVRLLPTVEIGRAYRRVLQRAGRELLTYGDSRGHARLRAALSGMLGSARGLRVSEDEMLVTRGSQMALDLTARALLAPGDVVAVEALGQRATWTAFRAAGARLVPVPVDAEGLCVDLLPELMTRHPLRAIYVTPHNQFPTTAVLSAARRARLLTFARTHGVAIIEDDYDNEFRYDGRAVPPLAADDTAGVVLYVGTLSKVLAPGLRIGFVVAPAPVIDRLVALRFSVDQQGDLAVECAVAELFESGEFDRHVRRVRGAYMARRDALAAALARELGDVLHFRLPSGGMALWARVSDDVDIDEWAYYAQPLGVIFRGARPYDFDGAYQPYARLGFSFHDEDELSEAVRRMALALRQVGRRQSPSSPSSSERMVKL